MFEIVLLIHIAAGTTGLLLGPVSMIARKRRGIHTTAGEVYHWVMLVVCLTAGVLAILHWDTSWFFLPIGAFSYWNAYSGYAAAKRRFSGWLQVHIRGMIGSYIALVTALLVVNSNRIPGVSHLSSLTWLIPVWLLPSIVGSYIIYVIQRRYLRPPKGPSTTKVDLNPE